MYTPGPENLELPLWVTPFTTASLGQPTRANGGAAPASATWVATNRILYVQFYNPKQVTVYRYFWLNGATVGTNNFQVGIYNDNDAGTDGPGTSFNLGTSTLSAGTANRPQYNNVTDFALPPGRFWMAMWGSGTTATVFRLAPSANFTRNLVYYQEAGGAGGLPATAAPAAWANSFIPVFGFTTVATP